MHMYFRLVTTALLTLSMSNSLTGAEDHGKSLQGDKTTKLDLKLADGGGKTISVSLGQTARDVYNLCKPAKVYADDDPWFTYLAADGGAYAFLFSAEGTAEEMKGRLDPRRNKLYAVLRYPRESRDGGKLLLPGTMRDKTYGDFVTLKVPLGPDKAKVATVALGMNVEEVKHLFPGASDSAGENHAVVLDSVYADSKYLLIFTPQDDGDTHDPQPDKLPDKLSEVIYRFGKKAETIYLLPRNKRGKPVAAKHRELLGSSDKSDSGK